MDLIIFDIDGTLIHSHIKEVDCFIAAVTTVLGIKEINRDLHTYQHVTDKGILIECVFRTLNRHPTKEECDAIQDQYFTNFSAALAHEPIQLIPGAHTLLETLQALPNTALAVATGSYYRAAMLKLSHVTPAWCDIPLSTSDDSEIRTLIMESALHKAKQFYGKEQFNRIIYVGDGPWDIKAVKALEWNFVGIASNYPKHQLQEWGATCVISDYVETHFVDVINNLT